MDTDSLLQQGRKLQEQKDLNQAIAAFKKLIKIKSNSAEAYHFLGECFAQQNSLPKAIEAYQQAIKLNPDNPWTHHCLGQVFFWQGDTEAAIACSQQSIQLEPQKSAFHVQLGEYFTQQRKNTNAIAAYQKAIALNSQLSETHHSQLITLLLAEGKVESALSVNIHAIAHYPDSSILHFQQGNIYTAKENLLEAKASYDKAIEIEPDFWEAYQKLGDILVRLGKSQAAQQSYQLSETKFYQVQNFDKVDLPPDFDWQIYLALNPEFDFSSKFEAIVHLMNYGLKENKLYALHHLHNPQKRPDIAPPSIINSGLKNINTDIFGNKKLAVLVHIYYFDLWSELCSYIQNIEVEFDLYVNIVASTWQPSMHERIRVDFPQARIIISPNRGKDIGGHLSLMSYLDFKKYDLFCLIHTKKSPHIDSRVADIWRHDLLDAILGSAAKTKHNLMLMREHSYLGLLGSRYWRSTEVGNNQENYQCLIDKLAIVKPAQNCEYLSGTMMLVRTEIVREIHEKLHNLELEFGDNRELGFHVDGQLAHAIERIIGNLVRDRGLKFFWQE